MLEKIVPTINSAGKYVSLNLSGNALTTIPDWTFCDMSTGIIKSCVLLTAIAIPNSVTSIGDYAFSTSSLASVAFQRTNISIGKSSFLGNLFGKYIAGGKGTYKIPDGYAYGFWFSEKEISEFPAGYTGFIGTWTDIEGNEWVFNADK